MTVTAAGRSAFDIERRPIAGRTAVRSVPSVRWALIALALFLAGLGAQFAGAPAAVWWTLYLASYAGGGWPSAWAGAGIAQQDP